MKHYGILIAILIIGYFVGAMYPAPAMMLKAKTGL